MAESSKGLGGGNPVPPGGFTGRIGRVHSLDSGGYGIRPRNVGSTQFEQVEVPRDVLDRNDARRDARQANIRAGLSADGMASYQTSRGTGVYDPSDESDVERMRKIIRGDDGDAAADAWEPFRFPLEPADDDPDDSDAIRCHVCSDAFPNRARLSQHVGVRHPGAEPPPPSPEPEPEPDPEPEPTPEDLRDLYEDDAPPMRDIRADAPPWLRDL